MRSSNPALSAAKFKGLSVVPSEAMTLQGTTQKSMILMGLLLFAGVFSWNTVLANPSAAMMPMLVGGIGGFVVAMATIFKPTWSPYTAPLYALLEGLVLGAISAMYNAQYDGIIVQAVLLTLGVLFAMHSMYAMGWIQVTDKFRSGVFAATAGIAVVYIVSMVLGFFGIHLSFLYDSSPLSIGISLLVTGVAALNLVLDFDTIDQGVKAHAPKYMEWYASFGLLVTLVWLYLEILRLLSKLRGRD